MEFSLTCSCVNVNKPKLFKKWLPYPIEVKVYKWDQVKPLIYNWREARDGFQIFFLKLLVPSTEKHNLKNYWYYLKPLYIWKKLFTTWIHMLQVILHSSTFRSVKKLDWRLPKNVQLILLTQILPPACIFVFGSGPEEDRGVEGLKHAVQALCLAKSNLNLNMLYKFYV